MSHVKWNYAGHVEDDTIYVEQNKLRNTVVGRLQCKLMNNFTKIMDKGRQRLAQNKAKWKKVGRGPTLV